MIMTKLEVTQKIIEAAVQEFMVKGLDGSSMENIAKMAEVSKRTLYKYYPNKEAIFDALVMELLETACAFPGQVYSKTETLEDQINNIVEAKAQLLTSEDYIKISRLVLSEVMKGRKMNESQLAQFYESEKKFLKWIDAAKKDGKIKSKQSSELIATQVHSIVKGQLFYPVIFGVKAKLSPADIKLAKKITIEFFLNSFC